MKASEPRKRWDYDGSIARFPMQPGEVWTCECGTVMVNDLYDGIPDFTLTADCVFVDPPYNLALENGFRTKAGRPATNTDFVNFLDALFAGIDRIAPATCFIEIGNQHLATVRDRLTARYPFATIYPATYYHKAANHCFVVR